MTGALQKLDDPGARELARDLLARAPRELLAVDDIDLAPALEQAIFATLRAPPHRARALPTTFARVARAALDGLLPDAPMHGSDLLVVLLNSVHLQVFAPVRAALAEMAPNLRVGFVRVSRAAADTRAADLPRADRHLARRKIPALFRFASRRPRIEASLRDAWAPRVGAPAAGRLAGLAGDSLVRLGIEGLQLDAVLQAARPRVVATYDEINAYSRLLPVLADRHGAVCLDLPHAEAANPHAISGVRYDWMAVFGRRAAEVLATSGFPPDRVVEVGAARFETLLKRHAAAPDSPPRIVMAAQSETGPMTRQTRARILQIAVAAAAAVRPAVVQVRPHPVESAKAWVEIVSSAERQARVEVRIEEAELHELLPGAFALVTGWSNSVFEAVIAGVPAITAHVTPGAPVASFAAEGIALQATSENEAAAIAERLSDAAERGQVLSAARERLEPHLGPLDGQAAYRTAALIKRLSEPARASGSPRE